MATDSARLPLAGRTICVTRTAEQAAPLAASLVARGARVLSLPTIAIEPPPSEDVIRAAIPHLDDFSWLILTSTNAVERFFGYLAEAGMSDIPNTLSVAVVGSATASSLAAHGVAPSLIPEDYRGEGLVEEFDRMGVAVPGTKVLFPRALVARELLTNHLESLGYEVTVAPVYRTVAAEISADQLTELASIDGITFTSPSTARYFFEGCREAGMDPLAVLTGVAVFSIGPVTTAELDALGVDAASVHEPADSTTAELVGTIVTVLGE